MPVAEQRSAPRYQLLTGSKVYLIHLVTPLKHARHYLGFSEDLFKRLQKHRTGQGAAFMKAIAEDLK